MDARAGRPLTEGERRLARSVFGAAIDYDRVRVHRRKWWPFQTRLITMAPDGHLWFHPDSPHWCDDFSCAARPAQGLFVHEMTHVWQHQSGIFLPLARHPFCRYGYALSPGKPFGRYGIEQQAEIVRHAWLARLGGRTPGASEDYEALLPFASA
jgi:hypothetical protein